MKSFEPPSALHNLGQHQQKAYLFVHECATSRGSASRIAIAELLSTASVDTHLYDKAMEGIRLHGYIVLNFHPERLTVSGRSVAEGLLCEGVYKTQYETGVSAGSTSAFPGGERDLWEDKLFGGAYHTKGLNPADRPKYGALEVMYHADGAAPRFGSCFFVLKHDVINRSTFTYGGSNEESALDKTGTVYAFDTVMAALLTDVMKGKGAFGVKDITVNDLLDRMSKMESQWYSDKLGKSLDSFIEAQVHGTLDLREDVEALVADSSFRNSPIEEVFSAISAKYNIRLSWHPGYSISVSDVPETFRGYPTAALARRIRSTGNLNAYIVGIAANSFQLDQSLFGDFGSHEDILTLFRRLWHVLVLYGRPFAGD